MFVEGNEASLDQPFYSWLLGPCDVRVVALGSCASVRAAAGHEDVWAHLGNSPCVGGVVDRDFRSDDNVREISSSASMCVLDVHELESYLCDPDVICALADAVGATNLTPKRADVMRIIARFAKRKMVSVAGRRASEILRIDVGVSASNTSLARVEDEQAVIALLINQAKRQQDLIQKWIGPSRVAEVVHAEMTRYRNAVDSGNLDELLVLLPGKELLVQLVPLTGLKSSSHVLNCTINKLDVDHFERLKRLRTKLLPLLEASST